VQHVQRLGRAALEKAVKAARHRGKDANERVDGTMCGGGYREIRGTVLQVSVEDRRGNQPPVEERRKTSARAPIAKLGEHERNMFVLSSQTAARPQRAIK
jgi:hypothetical protein